MLFPEEYDPIVYAMKSKEDLCLLDELGSSLLTHESYLEKNGKVFIIEHVFLNLTQAPPSSAQHSTKVLSADSNLNFPIGTSHVTTNTENHGCGSLGGRFGRGGDRFGCGGGRFGKVYK